MTKNRDVQEVGIVFGDFKLVPLDDRNWELCHRHETADTRTARESGTVGKVRWHRLGRYYQHNTIHLAIQYAADRALKDGAHGTQMELMDALHEYETITRALVAEVARAAITATAPLADEARGVVTPAQAIAATLGNEGVARSNDGVAELGAGTCHETMIDRFFRGCSECGYMWEYMYGIGRCQRPNYCPNCGRKVVDDG